MSLPPPPGSPPPPGPPPSFGPPPPPGPESLPSRPLLPAGGVWLDDVVNPYPMWAAATCVAIMTAPNLLSLATGSLGAEAVELTSVELAFLLGVTLVFQVLLFGAALLPLLIGRRLDGRLFGPTPWSGRMLGFGLAVGLVTVVVSYTLNAFLAILLRIEDPVDQGLLRSAVEGGIPLLLTLIIAVLVGPFVEEVVFRGVLFRALLPRLGTTLAALLSAAVFAVIHVEVVFSQPVALAGLFVVGFLLAVAYRLTGNLWVPIIGHAAFNAFSMGLLLAVDRLAPDELSRTLGTVVAALRLV